MSGTSGRGGAGGAAAAHGDGGKTGAAGASAGSSKSGAGNNAGKSGVGNNAGTGNTAGTVGTGGTRATGGGAGEAGGGGEGGLGGAGPTECDPTKTPSEDTCVINEDYGVFVSPSGDDVDGNGSRSKPYATIAKTIGKAKMSGKRVYACADGGSYSEILDIDATVSGVELYGGFTCHRWTYSTNAKSRIASGTPLGLHIENVTALHLEDFQIEAADATDAGGSSVGVFVVSSTDVVFRRVDVNAGKGKDGSDGTRKDFVFPARADLDGNSATSGTQGLAKVCSCPDSAVTSGGGGGRASLGKQSGGIGTPNFGGGQGGDSLAPSCSMGGGGSNGANALAGTSAPGALMLGTLTSSGWTPASGTDGTSGLPGQGGGGGASSASGGGGGGGSGSCGGAAGKSGQGGGASIALAAFSSTVTVDDCELDSSDAGKGGNGIAGQNAQTQAGFAGNGTMGGCSGGAGGLGAAGTASGGGAGGISVGILWSGSSAPVQNDLTFSHGTRGTKGVGGDPGVNDGISGEAADVKQAP
jgi:hypothetical protein